jgi:hypothetical protein
MTGTVAAGRYELEVGASPGTLVSSPAQPQEGDPRPLRRALKHGGGDGKRKKAAASPVRDVGVKASEVTAKAERAVALFRALVEGRIDAKQLSSEIDALLELLERLDRDGRWQEALRLGRAACGLLALTMRWAELVRSLNIALRAAVNLDESAAAAWARHELGTLHLAAEDAAGAERWLGEAREIRERIADRRGLAATERNLQVLCQQLRQLVRDGRLVQRRGVLRAVLAVAVALLLVAAVATAVVPSGGATDPPVNPPPPGACNNAKDDDGDGSTDGNDPGCGDGTEAPANERPPRECNNAKDDDGDGLIDFGSDRARNDPGCASADDDDESNAVPKACADGQDNDGDGLIDFGSGRARNDPGCASADDDDDSNAVPKACADGQDNDLDGLPDGNDPQCTSADDDDEGIGIG